MHIVNPKNQGNISFKLILSVGAFIIIVLLLLLALQGSSMYKTLSGEKAQNNKLPVNSNAPSPNSQAPSSDSLNAVDQEASAGAITITSANLTKPGYIEIFKQEKDLTGPLVAVSNLLQAGTAKDVVLKTLEGVSLKAGDVLIAHISFDNGKGAYNKSLSTVGKPGIYQKFKIK